MKRTPSNEGYSALTAPFLGSLSEGVRSSL